MRAWLILLTIAVGCKGGAPGALGKAEGKSNATAPAAPAPAPSPENDKASPPTEVSGAFLFCSSDAQAPDGVDPGTDDALIACIMKDKDGNRVDGKAHDVKVTLSNGQPVDAITTPPPSDSPWHVYFKMSKIDFDILGAILLDVVTAAGTVEGKTTSADFNWQDDPLFLKNLGIAYFYEKYGDAVNNLVYTPVPLAAAPADAKHLIFATQKLYKPNFGGIDGANKICAAAGAVADATRTWQALLGTSKIALKDTITINGPVYNLMAEKVADTGVELFGTANRQHPVTYTEIGFDTDTYVLSVIKVKFDRVWTGSNDVGELNPAKGTCADWTANDFNTSASNGAADFAKTNWLEEADPVPCDHMARLYCISK